jgi:hypothetical protein
VDTVVVVEVDTVLVVWVVEALVVVAVEVAVAVVWVTFAAPVGSTVMATHTRNTRNTVVIVLRELPAGTLSKIFPTYC